MGEVYEAIQEPLSRRVAVKTLNAAVAEGSEAFLRFRREAEATAALGHPNIVQVTDFRAKPGEPPILVMELLAGETLKDLVVREKRLVPERAVFIALQILAGLAAAHRAGVIHRDIKPANVFVQQTSAVRDLVKIVDFGIAKLVTSNLLTEGGQVLGTMAYMAPEQAIGARVDARADLYALGATLFHLLSGLRLVDVTQPGGARAALGDVAPWLPLGLVQAVERALARDPEGRWPSAEAMSAALEPFARAVAPVSPSSGLSPYTAPAADAAPTVGVGTGPAPVTMPTEVTAPPRDETAKHVLAAIAFACLVLGVWYVIGRVRVRLAQEEIEREMFAHETHFNACLDGSKCARREVEGRSFPLCTGKVTPEAIEHAGVLVEGPHLAYTRGSAATGDRRFQVIGTGEDLPWDPALVLGVLCNPQAARSFSP